MDKPQEFVKLIVSQSSTALSYLSWHSHGKSLTPHKTPWARENSNLLCVCNPSFSLFEMDLPHKQTHSIPWCHPGNAVLQIRIGFHWFLSFQSLIDQHLALYVNKYFFELENKAILSYLQHYIIKHYFLI